MTDRPSASRNRREFLAGKSLRDQIESAGDRLADGLVEATAEQEPVAGDTLCLTTTAMACDFSVFLNPGHAAEIDAASESLDLVHQLEAQMSVFRPDSEISRLNRQAATSPIEVERRLFELLLEAERVSRQTEGSFDLTAGPLIDLWNGCRREHRIPTDTEINETLQRIGTPYVQFDTDSRSVRFTQDHVTLNLGGIGKGYALDRAAERLNELGTADFLLHGGHSSVLARGDHNQLGGWPVGIRNPLFPKERFGTVLLRNQALASSGSGVQYFRVGGKRYGHILDPRTGWPVEGMLSVTVLAPTAAEADALSTAFFVGGVEIARQYCDNHESVSVVLIPPPHRGRTLEPIIYGLPDNTFFLAPA